MARRASYIDSTRIRYGDPVLVDCGDWSGAASHEQVKSPFMLDMMKLLGYDAVTVGEREFNFGYEWFRELTEQRDLQIVSANLRDKRSGKLVFDDFVVVRKNGVKVGITGLLGSTIPLGTVADSLTVDDPLATAQELIPKIRKKADVVVLLAHTGRVDAYDLASQVPGIDVVVIGHHPGTVIRSRKLNETIAVSSGEQGQNIGETLLYLDGKNVTNSDGKVVILMPEVGERAEIAKLQTEFEEQLNKELRERQQREALSANQMRPGAPHYLGMDACISCHVPQYEQWKSTPHAHAFQTLVDQSKEATPDCVSCHVTGWDQPGGFQNQVTTAGMADVQCEVCHGMGTEHNLFAESNGPPPESLCLTCHTPENDPSWNYAAKLPKVMH